MKKYTALLLALLMVFSLCACGNGTKSAKSSETASESRGESPLKIAYLFALDSSSPKVTSRTEAIRKMQEETGLSDDQIVIKTGVKRDDCEKVAEALINDGCTLIFSTNSGFESAMVTLAEKYSEVQFCQEDGTKAEKSGLMNLHNYYVRLYEGYYVAGVVMGAKINYLLNSGNLSAANCVIGFVASREAPETISCINAFSLGVEKMCTQASVLVRYVGKTGDYDADGKAARQLIAAGAHLMAQYTLTTAVAAVCAENDTPLVGNEINLINTAPKEALTSATADWSGYYTYAVKAMQNSETIDTDWTGGYAESAVVISQLNDEHVAEGTADKVAEVEKELRDGTAKVFDTTKFTIGGSSLETLAAENDSFKKYKKYIKDGEFQESVKRSAPIFDTLIDGVSVSTQDYLGSEEDTASEATTEQQ